MRPKVVYDTNVIVSAALKPESVPGSLVKLARNKRVRLFLSEEIIREYREVLERPKFGFERRALERFFASNLKVATVVKPAKRFHAALDEPDNRFLECAARARADYLVTGNKKHFPFAAFRGVQIVTPAGFLAALRG